jgi:ubiquinone/menaquinone biosynthesis C-methylase UbiE
MSHQQTYVPALGIEQLTPIYDAAMASLFQERSFRMPLVNTMRVLPGQQVLDIGCGTATLSLLIAEQTDAGLVTGLDIDPAMLIVAQRKIAYAHSRVSLGRGSADTLPYADQSFNHVVSSLMFHHLATPQKHAMLAEVWRVLKPGGQLVVMDFGPIGRGAMAQGVAALFGRFEHVNDNLYGRVPTFLGQAGFVEVTVTDVAFAGVIKLYVGRRPERAKI